MTKRTKDAARKVDAMEPETPLHVEESLDEMLSIKELAAHWKISERSVRRKIKSGELRAQPIGGLVRIRVSEVKAYMQRQQEGASDSMQAETVIARVRAAKRGRS